MLERTVAALGRWLGRTKAAEAAQRADSDRRAWIRFHADMTTTCQPATTADGVRCSARIVNISLGGINLVVDQAVKSGTLLSVELPTAPGQETNTALACVVRVIELPSGEWSLGCSFARELGEEEMQAFGVKRLRPSSSDQRNWMRFPSALTVTYRLAADTTSPLRETQLVDLSPVGVGLLVEEPVEVGALLQLDLPATEGTLSMLALVVHVKTDATNRVLGCHFIRELSDEELHAML